MQSTADVGVHQPVAKTESENTLPSTSTIQTSSVAPYLQASSNSSLPTNVALAHTSIKQVNLSARPDKPANGNSISQNNRFIPASTCVTTYHIPRGTATVANISVPRASLATPLVRSTPIPHVQATTTIPASATSAFIPALSRPGSTWVVTNTTSSAILQKTATLSVVPSTTYVKPPSTMTVTSRIAAPIVSKSSDTAVKPIILHNTPKQLITQTTNQLQDRNTGGLLKTNVGMVTIRGSTITPSLQPQAKVTPVTQVSQPPRLTVSVPMLVPATATVRKPQTLAPKIITQSARAPFTVQSIPVSVSHTPSALTMNKKTAGITVGSNQTTIAGQNTTTIVRSTPTVVAPNAMIAKVYPAGSEIRATPPPTNLLIQAAPKAPNTGISNTNVTAFTAPTTTYMYESENFQVKRTLVSSSCTAFTSSVTPLTTAIPRHFNVVSSINSNPIPRLNPIMVVESPRVAASVTPTSPSPVQPSTVTIQSYVIPQGRVGNNHNMTSVQQLSMIRTSIAPTLQPTPLPQQPQRVSPVPQQQPSNMKQNASPRPSILRKRDIDGSLAKAQRNLTPLLNSLSTSSTVPSPPPSPHMPDISGGQSSNSSSTLSATSSPGIPIIDPESPTSKSERPLLIAHCDEELRTTSLVEMSPRKKPRKQQLGGNLSNEPKLEDDMEFISDDKIKKESRDTLDAVPMIQEPQKASSSSSSSSKKPNISILSGYNHGWKSRHHHFLRYSDVKYKEEKKPAVNDIANQKYVSQKINGWKIYHLSAQMENLHDIEIEVVDKLSSLLKLFKSHPENDENKSLNRTNELFMGNMQRSKVVSDQLKEAKTQMMKVFNHKKHVSDIINKYASKRTIKKKGRY